MYSQVKLMLDEYLSFPIDTVYKVEEVNELANPAFTICPRPSVKYPFKPNYFRNVRDFKNISVSFQDVVTEAFWKYYGKVNETTINGETIGRFDGVFFLILK